MGSKALDNLLNGLGAVDHVLSFAKAGQGKPSAKEQSLFVASVALSYAVWENYVEEVAIEVTTFLSRDLDPGAVPSSVRDWILKRQPPPTAWDLAVHPGWKQLWIDTVTAKAQGAADNARDFGMLTANAAQVSSLFERVGLSPFDGVSDDDLAKLDRLVGERGQIVHTGKAPTDFRKGNATDWRSFVESLSRQVDATLSHTAEALSGKKPWTAPSSSPANSPLKKAATKKAPAKKAVVRKSRALVTKS